MMVVNKAGAAQHRMNPTGPSGPRSIGAFVFVDGLIMEQVLYGPARRVMPTVGPRQEGMMSTTERADRQETLKAVLHYFYQENTRSGAHCRYNLKYHLVWITKYRRAFLVGKLAERLSQLFAEIAHDYGFRIIAHEVMPDHVHLLVETPPKYAPSKIVQIFKGISSRRMRQEFFDTIKRYIWREGTLWARGYYIASVADKVTTGIVQEYINNQKVEKTSSKTTNPEHSQATFFDT